MSSRFLLPFFALLACPSVHGQGLSQNRFVDIDDAHKGMPLRIITRPFAKIHEDRNDKAAVLKTPPAFSVYYVIGSRPGANLSAEKSWYQIADHTARSVGFVKGSDLMEWKQTLCLEFESPVQRRPILFFKERERLEALMTASPESRTASVGSLYSTIAAIADGNEIGEDFPILSMEPRRQQDITSSFYLLPILEHSVIRSGDYEDVPVLKVAAAANKGAGAVKTTLDDRSFVKSANQASDLSAVRNAPVDIVFCFDLTGSMQPFVDACVRVADYVASNLGRELQKVRFGFVGYRDSMDIQGIEFNTKNFTPELQSVEQFVSTLRGIKACKPLKDDYEEDMLGGFMQAVESSHWRPEAIKFLILAGDAPGHEPPHRGNSSGQGVAQLRQKATEKNVHVFSMHIQHPSFAKYHSSGQFQFSALAQNAANLKNASVVVSGTNTEALANSFSDAAGLLFEGLKDAILKGKIPASSTKATSTEASSDVQDAVNSLFQAAVVEWLGRQTETMPVNGITGWISPRDLIEPQASAVKVKILLKKNELDSLAVALRTVVRAGLESRNAGKDFFDALQSVAATTLRQPDKIGTLSDTGLLPQFILGLPYRSRVLDLTNEKWAAENATWQEKFLHDIESMISYYDSLLKDPTRWISLSSNAADDEKVTPVPLEQLP
jgi:serine/threonine-protein kinase PpkA